MRAGEVAKPDGAKVLDLLKARMEALASPQQDAETPPAGSDAAPPVAAVLDPEDPWAVAIEGASSAEDAEGLLEDVTDQRSRDEIDPERAALVEQAIEARFPGMSREPVAA